MGCPDSKARTNKTPVQTSWFRISESSGKRPTSCFEKMSEPSRSTSKIPPAPAPTAAAAGGVTDPVIAPGGGKYYVVVEGDNFGNARPVDSDLGSNRFHENGRFSFV